MKNFRQGWGFIYRGGTNPSPPLSPMVQKSLCHLMIPQQEENDSCKEGEASPFKVTIVGAGKVGMAFTILCLLQRTSRDICLIDKDERKLSGEVMDLSYGSLFLQHEIHRTDYEGSADSALCIVTATAGALSGPKRTRMDLLYENAKIIKEIIPKLVKYSPNTILLIVSNPVDVLTHLAWKVSGLPKNRVFGSGTNLDTARFKYFLSKEFNVSVNNIDGLIIGEHGETCVPVWSSVNISGVPFTKIQDLFDTPEDSEKWCDEMRNKVVKSAYDVIALKGYTSWAVGLSCAQLVNAVFKNKNTIHPVSTLVQGTHGVDHEVFISVPCVIGSSGVKSIVDQCLTEEEICRFHKSCDYIFEAQNKVD